MVRGASKPSSVSPAEWTRVKMPPLSLNATWNHTRAPKFFSGPFIREESTTATARDADRRPRGVREAEDFSEEAEGSGSLGSASHATHHRQHVHVYRRPRTAAHTHPTLGGYVNASLRSWRTSAVGRGHGARASSAWSGGLGPDDAGGWSQSQPHPSSHPSRPHPSGAVDGTFAGGARGAPSLARPSTAVGFGTATRSGIEPPPRRVAASRATPSSRAPQPRMSAAARERGRLRESARPLGDGERWGREREGGLGGGAGGFHVARPDSPSREPLGEGRCVSVAPMPPFAPTPPGAEGSAEDDAEHESARRFGSSERPVTAGGGGRESPMGAFVAARLAEARRNNDQDLLKVRDRHGSWSARRRFVAGGGSEPVRSRSVMAVRHGAAGGRDDSDLPGRDDSGRPLFDGCVPSLDEFEAFGPSWGKSSTLQASGGLDVREFGGGSPEARHPRVSDAFLEAADAAVAEVNGARTHQTRGFANDKVRETFLVGERWHREKTTAELRDKFGIVLVGAPITSAAGEVQVRGGGGATGAPDEAMNPTVVAEVLGDLDEDDPAVVALQAHEEALRVELREMKTALREQLADFTGVDLPNPNYEKYDEAEMEARAQARRAAASRRSSRLSRRLNSLDDDDDSDSASEDDALFPGSPGYSSGGGYDSTATERNERDGRGDDGDGSYPTGRSTSQSRRTLRSRERSTSRGRSRRGERRGESAASEAGGGGKSPGESPERRPESAGQGVTFSTMDYRAAATEMMALHPRQVALRVTAMSSTDAAAIFGFFDASFMAEVVCNMPASAVAMILDMCDAVEDILPVLTLLTDVDGINEMGMAARIMSHMTEAGKVGEVIDGLDLKTAMALLAILEPSKVAFFMPRVSREFAAELLPFLDGRAKIIEEMETSAAAHILSAIKPEGRGKMFATMTPASVPRVLSAMAPEAVTGGMLTMAFGQQCKVLAAVPTPTASRFLNSMDIEDIVPFVDGRGGEHGLTPSTLAPLVAEIVSPLAATILSRAEPRQAALILVEAEEKPRNAILKALSADVRGRILKEMAKMGGSDGRATLGAKDLAMLDAASAAEVMNTMDASAAAKLLESMSADQAASLMRNMDAKSAASAMSEMSIDKAADVLESMSDTAAAGVVSEMSAEKAADLLAAVDAEKAAGIVGAMDADKAASALASMDADQAAEVMNNLDASKAAEVLSNMDADAAAAVLSNVDADKAAAALASMDADQAAAAMNGLDASKAGAVLSNMDADKAASLVGSMGASAAAGALRSMDSEAAAAVVGSMDGASAGAVLSKMDAGAAAAVLDNLEGDKAAEILGGMNAAAAADAMNGMDTTKAAAALSSMDADKAAGVVGNMSADKAAAALGNMDAAAAAALVGNMDASKAAGVLGAMSTEQASQLVSGMGSAEAAAALGNMDANAAAAILGDMDGSKAAEVLNDLSSAAAAEVLSSLDAGKAATMLGSMDGKAAAAAVSTMDASKAAEVIGSMDASKAAEVIGSMGAADAAGVLSNLDSAKAAEMLSGMDDAAAAAVMDELDASKAADVLGGVDASKAAALAASMAADKAAEALSQMDATSAAGVLSSMSTENAATVIEAMDANAAAAALMSMSSTNASQIMKSMARDKAAETLSHVSPDKAAEVMAALAAENAAAILGAMAPDKAAAVLAAMDPVHAAAVLSEASSAAAAAALAHMDTAAAAACLSSMAPDAASRALDEMSPEDASRLLGSMDPDNAARLVAGMDPGSAAEALTVMSPEDASRLLGAMDPASAARVLSKMDDSKAAELLAALSPDAAAELLAAGGVSAGAAAEYLAALDTADAGAALARMAGTNPAGAGAALARMDEASAAAIIAAAVEADPDAARASFDALARCSPEAAVAVLGRLSGEDAAVLLAGTAPDALAGILGALDGDKAAAILAGSIAREGARRAAETIAAMDPAAAADVVRRMRPEDAAAILVALDDETRARLLDGLSLEEQAAMLGAIPPDAFLSMRGDVAADLLTMLGAERASGTLLAMILRDVDGAGAVLASFGGGAAGDMIVEVSKTKSFQNGGVNGAEAAAAVLSSASRTGEGSPHVVRAAYAAGGAGIFARLLPLLHGDGELWLGCGSPVPSGLVHETNAVRSKRSYAAAGALVLCLSSDTSMINDVMETVGGDTIGRCFADVSDEVDDEGKIAEALIGWHGSGGGAGASADEAVVFPALERGEDSVAAAASLAVTSTDRELAKALAAMWTSGKASAREKVTGTLLSMHLEDEVRCECVIGAMEEELTRREMRESLRQARESRNEEIVKNVAYDLGLIHRTLWHKAIKTHFRLVAIRQHMEHLARELEKMMRELEGFQSPPQSVVAIAVALLIMLNPDEVIPLVGDAMRPPTQPVQCKTLYKQLKPFLNAKDTSVEGSTVGAMMRVTERVFANRQAYADEYGHLLVASRRILHVELGEAAINRALRPARYISKWLDSLLGAVKGLIPPA